MFPFNWDPQRVGTHLPVYLFTGGGAVGGVSIQLGSPASGDSRFSFSDVPYWMLFPFNWDPQRVGTGVVMATVLFLGCFHSIGIPSEWGQSGSGVTMALPKMSFHSIGIPSEWGLCPIKTHTGRAFQAPFARDSHFLPNSPPKSPLQTASNPYSVSHRGIERETVIPAILAIPRSVFLNSDSLPSLGLREII